MRAEWIYVSVVLCFALQWQPLHGRSPQDPPTCEDVCKGLDVPDGCKFADKSIEGFKEEVIVVTNGTSDITMWKWDTINMVVSEYFSSTRSTGYTACYTHSQGRRYGLRESVPFEIDKLLNDKDNVKTKFTEMIMTYRKLLMADHVVYDLLAFFQNLQNVQNQTQNQMALSIMKNLLTDVIEEVKKQHARASYCVVPWEPPCETGKCGGSAGVQELLALCDVLMMSPDSYLPVADSEGRCQAQATVPISKFLYGIDRYISLRHNAGLSIVAGIPWHGYAYNCDEPISDNKCVIKKQAGEVCFSRDNRQRQSLADIHSANPPPDQTNMDVVSKGIYHNLNSTAQLWYENFTTLLIKYQLVNDLQLRGLSLWYGEDMTVGMSRDRAGLSMKFWSFLTHHVLHATVYNPKPISHHTADTVAGVGVGCLLLGTLLGTVFTCIGFRHSRIRRINRPFKLDEDDNAFRDDEGL